MNPEFWQQKWQNNELGFHLPDVHPLLVRYLTKERQQQLSCVFVPLCGKTKDIPWLMAQGLEVRAIELSELAVKSLFSEMNITPEVTDWQGGKCYRTDGLTVWVGDFFQLSNEQLQGVDLIYDRAALIALPVEMRAQYAAKMAQWLPQAKQLVITLDYDQSQMAGPPFAVSEGELAGHYANHWQLECLSQKDILEHEPKFAQRGLKALTESIFWLSAR